MLPHHRHRPVGWAGWAIIAMLLIAVPVACAVSEASQAQEPPHETRADGAAVVEDVRCADGWCVVRQDTLKAILNHLTVLAAKVAELEKLCGWKRP